MIESAVSLGMSSNNRWIPKGEYGMGVISHVIFSEPFRFECGSERTPDLISVSAWRGSSRNVALEAPKCASYAFTSSAVPHLVE